MRTKCVTRSSAAAAQFRFHRPLSYLRMHTAVVVAYSLALLYAHQARHRQPRTWVASGRLPSKDCCSNLSGLNSFDGEEACLQRWQVRCSENVYTEAQKYKHNLHTCTYFPRLFGMSAAAGQTRDPR